MTPEQSYREMYLSKGQVALVDAEDFEYLNRWKWSAVWNKRSHRWQVQRTGKVEGKYASIYMWREIMGLKKGDSAQVDHRNHDTLDNRRSNLRIATATQNHANSRLNIRNRSGFKGVERSIRRNGEIRYRASVTHKQVRIKSSYYTTPQAAHAWYCEMAKTIHGEFFFTPIEAQLFQK
jgi:hypothetical protein